MRITSFYIEGDVVAVAFASGSIVTRSRDWFEPVSGVHPDFEDIEIVDKGQTLRLGRYTVSADRLWLVVVPTTDDRGRPVEVSVAPGETYRFTTSVRTRAGQVYREGNLLHVHDPTQETPFGEMSGNGCNWICRGDYGISVWSTLESCIARGLLVRVEDEQHLSGTTGDGVAP